MQRVIIESPLKGDYERNRAYAKACMRDSLLRGEAPYASHLLYAQPGILDDEAHDERERGIEAGLVWGAVADFAAVYTDLGVSEGMQRGIDRHREQGLRVEWRTLRYAALTAALTAALDGAGR